MQSVFIAQRALLCIHKADRFSRKITRYITPLELYDFRLYAVVSASVLPSLVFDEQTLRTFIQKGISLLDSAELQKPTLYAIV